MKPLSLADKLPLPVGTLHFIGIGGIGMSGIAEILHNLGYKVQGSDASESANVARLRAMGVPVFISHKKSNIDSASVIVVSSAIKPENPEWQEARAKMIPIVRRAEMLAELMRFKLAIAVAGTHGKTTTTSMLAAVLEAAKFDPTVVNGGILNAYGTNARLGESAWMVVEADESDGTFTKIPATLAIVTNIDPEHLDHYGSFDQVKAAFRQFLENLPFYGFAALCLDHPEVQALIPQVTDRKLFTYGFNPQADVRVASLQLSSDASLFDVEIGERVCGKAHTLKGIRLPMLGEHNVKNALGVITIAHALGVEDSVILRAFAEFKGVKRRFTRTGEVNGITVIDDYGHHPVEIMATLKAARQSCSSAKGGHVIAVVQPHRYTRVRDLFREFATCFNDADSVIVTDIYPAGEQPIEGISKETLVESIREHGHKQALALKDRASLAATVAEIAKPGDCVVCLGAGSISQWAHELPGELQTTLDHTQRKPA